MSSIASIPYLWVTAKFMFNGLLKSNFNPSNKSGFKDTAPNHLLVMTDAVIDTHTRWQQVDVLQLQVPCKLTQSFPL